MQGLLLFWIIILVHCLLVYYLRCLDIALGIVLRRHLSPDLGCPKTNFVRSLFFTILIFSSQAVSFGNYL